MQEQQTTSKTVDTGIEITGVGVRTLDELLTLAKVDRNAWTVEWFRINKWDAPIGDGAVAAMWQVKATLKPVHPLVSLKDEILEEIRRVSPRVTLAPFTPPKGERYMLELAPYDLHLGMRAWARATGNTYNPEIAAKLFDGAIRELVARSSVYPVERILLVFGNDFFHVDTPAGTTTNGTAQDVAIGLQEMFRIGKVMLVNAVNYLKRVAPVEVVVVPGNHDQTTSLFLGETLGAWYHNDYSVVVDSEPRMRKYVKYGTTLLGFTHGRYEKLSDLPAIMAREEPSAWAVSTHREWHLGHYHRVHAEEFQGVRVRRLPSLTAQDEWHTRQGYGGLRAMEAYLWEYNRGYAGHLNITAREIEQ